MSAQNCGAILVDGGYEFRCRKAAGHGPMRESNPRTWHEDRVWLRNHASRTRMAGLMRWSGIPVPDPDPAP